MFTYRHVGQSICPLRFSIGRGYAAPSTRHPITSQTVIDIWAVSGYYDSNLLHIIVLIVHSVS